MKTKNKSKFKKVRSLIRKQRLIAAFKNGISFFILSFISGFLLFMVILSPISFQQYEKNSLDNYGYNSFVKYSNNPINAVTFLQTKNSASSTIDGYLSNIRATNDPNQDPLKSFHILFLKELRNIADLKEDNPYPPDNPQARADIKSLLSQILTKLPWLGGQVSTSELLKLLSSDFKELFPQCFNSDSSKIPSACWVATGGTVEYNLLALIAPISGIHVAFYTSDKTLTKSSPIDFTYFPCDATLVPSNDSTIKLDNGLYLSNNLNYFQKGNPNYCTPIHGIGDAFTQAVKDFAPYFVQQSFDKNKKNFAVTYNVVPYQKTTNLKFTYEKSHLNDSEIWGVDFKNVNSKFYFNISKNQQLLDKLRTFNQSPTLNKPLPVAINRNYNFVNSRLRLGDKFNYQIEVPALYDKGKLLTDLTKYTFDNGLFPALNYNSTNINQLVKNGDLKIQNKIINVPCQVLGITDDSAKPRLFTSQENLNNFIWSKFNVNAPPISQKTQIGYQGYFNGKFSMKNVPFDANYFELTQQYGSYDKTGLQGGEGYSKLGTGDTLQIFSVPTATQAFQKIATIVLSLLIVSAFFLLLFACIFLTTAVNIMLNNSRSKILMYKTFGYRPFQISNKFLLSFSGLVVFAFFIAIPASYFSYVAILSLVGKMNNFYLPTQIIWWEPIVSLVGSIFILVLNYVFTYIYVNKINLAEEWRTK